MAGLGDFVIAPFLAALLIPLAYSLMNGRKNLRAILAVVICSAAVVAFYPVVGMLSAAIPYFGYTIGKAVSFVLFPLVMLYYAEKWSIREGFRRLGVRRENIGRSVLYGLAAAAVTIAVTLLAVSASGFDALFGAVMFFEAFTEEFFFRGFLLLYLMKKTNRKAAYATSICAFVLAHPQNFTSLFVVSTAVQAVLLAVVADRTKNIMGPWVSHGLNRLIPNLIRSLAGF